MMTDRSLKRLNNGEIMAPMASDMVCPYSQSGQNGGKNATFMPTSRCATLGRVKNLEMTEYQRQKYVNGAAGSNIVSTYLGFYKRNNNTQRMTFVIRIFVTILVKNYIRLPF